ncbi:MAG: hypothetical protein WAU65_02335 [Candidatus Nanoarchaeia archaeon]
MPLIVVLETPYEGKRSTNKKRDSKYIRKCIMECLFNYREIPIPSHLFYDKLIKNKKKRGIESYLAMIDRPADATIVYMNLGISNEMNLGVEKAIKANRAIEYRNLRESAKLDLEDMAN